MPSETAHCHWCQDDDCPGCGQGECCAANDRNCGTGRVVPCPLRDAEVAEFYREPQGYADAMTATRDLGEDLATRA